MARAIIVLHATSRSDLMGYVRPLNELLVRKPLSSDAAAIATLHVRSWQSAYNGLLSAHYLNALSASVERRVAFLTHAIEAGSPCIRVAELNRQVVGWVSFGASRDEDAAASTAELMAIYLDPAFWACGIGTVLWTEAQQVMRDDGYQHVSAWVLDGNERARHFYTKRGFTPEAGSQRVIEENSEPLALTRFGRTLFTQSDHAKLERRANDGRASD
ncbi:GNAT family N-acetyltransferase [Pseudomonas sp. NC26]|nr:MULTISPECIES: GNAT family N-acetyltransferase [Pseudomonas]MCZ9639138.1 GNAT family N-acetyltransferase [Pseudomonas putida]MEC4874919.1 GNAT family N-acetyltransferase [Pseudomonas sp. NC26]